MRTLLSRCLLTFALLLPGWASAGLVVLQYHHVNADTPAVTSVSPEQFSEHMALLESEGMTIVDLADATRRLLAGEELPDSAVAITFDDAYRSIYTHALPELKQRGWPFTVFVSTGAVDQSFPDMMSWEELRELTEYGGRLANHTVSHAHLLEFPEGMRVEVFWESEILRAQQRLEDETGVTEKLFAYPYGEFSLTLADWLSEHGYLAWGQQSGATGASSHAQALPRFPASGVYAEPDTLRTKLHSLPFAVAADQLVNPLLERNPPRLTLRIPLQDFNAGQLTCYSGGEKMKAKTKQKKDTLQVELNAEKALTQRRSRFNCTAPSISKPGRFYWYSQPWLNNELPEPN